MSRRRTCRPRGVCRCWLPCCFHSPDARVRIGIDATDGLEQAQVQPPISDRTPPTRPSDNTPRSCAPGEGSEHAGLAGRHRSACSVSDHTPPTRPGDNTPPDHRATGGQQSCRARQAVTTQHVHQVATKKVAISPRACGYSCRGSAGSRGRCSGTGGGDCWAGKAHDCSERGSRALW